MSEKKLHTLIIDPEFRDMIPPLTEEEKTLLEESILRNGCEQPLAIWNGVIVDGHNRYAICQKHSIPFEISEKSFDDKNSALLWMIHNQLGRRNLPPYPRSELALRTEPLLREVAKRNQATSTGGADPQLLEISLKAEKTVHTDKELAKLAGVSDNTIRKARKISEGADHATKQKLRRGELTVNKVYTDLMKKEHEGEKKVCDRCKQEKPVADFSIPSNRHGFSSLCKDCEKEISAAAKAAAEVASATTAKVETHPVNGMAMLNGAPIHVATPLPDVPDMLPHVMSTLETAAHAFLATVGTSLRLMTRGIATKDNLRIYEAALLDVAEQAHEMFINHVKELEKQ